MKRNKNRKWKKMVNTACSVCLFECKVLKVVRFVIIAPYLRSPVCHWLAGRLLSGVQNGYFRLETWRISWHTLSTRLSVRTLFTKSTVLARVGSVRVGRVHTFLALEAYKIR